MTNHFAAATFTRNTARYCDGLSREFTVRFASIGTDRVTYAAIARQTCSDPLDCLAMTYDEALALANDFDATYYHALIGEVIALPEGWSND